MEFYVLLTMYLGIILVNDQLDAQFFFRTFLCMTTLSEVFLCFFLSCKANARVKPAKTGHGPHSS